MQRPPAPMSALAHPTIHSGSCGLPTIGIFLVIIVVIVVIVVIILVIFMTVVLQNFAQGFKQPLFFFVLLAISRCNRHVKCTYRLNVCRHLRLVGLQLAKSQAA